MRRDYAEFQKRQAEILCVGPDGPRSFQRFWEKEGMPFPGLSDHTHHVAGLYEQEIKLLKFGRMPALFVVDKSGRIRYSHHGGSMSDIPENPEILALLDKLLVEEAA